MIDQVRLALTALRTQGVPAGDDLATVAIPYEGGGRIALDRHGRPHLLLLLAPDEVPADAPDPRVTALDVGLRELDVDGRRASYLDVTCLFEAVAEVYEHFIVAVLDEIVKSHGSPVTALVRVLEKWRRFLEPVATALGREKLAAVFAELLVLLDVVREDPARRIDVWTGPFGGRHDFRRADEALEVKSTRSHTSRAISINGADQLEAPDGGALHLHLVRVEEAPGAGRSVASVVDELLDTGVSAEGLFAGLGAVGLPVVDLASTADTRFEIRERRTFRIDDAMPRIVPASFVGGSVPKGVVDLTYELDLDHALDCEIDADDYGSIVVRLGVAEPDA